MKLNRKQLRNLIMETAFQNEASKSNTSKPSREIEALNTLKDAAGAGELEIDPKQLGIKSLEKFGKIKIDSEFEEDESGKLTFKIDPKIQKKLKLKGFGDIKLEIGTEAAKISPEFAKDVKLPGLNGKIGIGVDIGGNYKNIADGNLKKAIKFKGINIDFSGKF
jgi:hypothetical protein